MQRARTLTPLYCRQVDPIVVLNPEGHLLKDEASLQKKHALHKDTETTLK